MGSWGTAIFSDDVAADVRADWREGILDGETPEELTAKLVSSHEADTEDTDDETVFWLALAAAQHETGRLTPDVRDKALEIIASGSDVARWEAEDPALAKQRERVLSRLQHKLVRPQPTPKRMKHPAPYAVPFEVGDAVLLRSPEGRRAIAVVVGQKPGWPKGTVDPVVELLLWDDHGELPSREFMATAPPLYTDADVPPPMRRGPIRIRPNLFAVSTAQKASAFNAEFGEVIATGIPRSPAGDYRDGSVMSGDIILSGVQWTWFGVFMDQPRFETMRNLTRGQTAPRRKRWTNLFNK
jgi:hypothetical protein